MIKKIIATLILSFVFISVVHAKEINLLKNNIENIIKNKNAIVGVSISGIAIKDTLNINGNKRFPMQSVFKFPIALAILAEVDKGNLSLEQKITIQKNELLPGMWSPISKKYPQGTTLTLAEIIEYTVGLSDNVGCDVLIKLLGGPEYIERYFSELGFKDFNVKINEQTMQNNWDMQFLNWTTPNEANQILAAFYNNNALLSDTSYEFIWNIMKATKTGKNRLRGQLPAEAIVAHKTGWSGQNKKTGITAAVNNIGVIFLPNGDHFFISVFITESSEDFKTNEKIISDIAKVAWDYFTDKQIFTFLHPSQHSNTIHIF